MGKVRAGAGLLMGCLILCGGQVFAATPAQILQYRPKQQDVAYSTPGAQDMEACKVKWTKTSPGGVWLLLDSQGRTLRRLVDNHGDNKPHIWSYYKDGVEVYREIDTDFDGEPDQYRWLNSGGMKWGVDLNKDHRIDAWRMISPEEVSQEILQAVISKDFNRLQPLFITDAEIKALNMPASDDTQIHELQKQAYAKFQNTVTKLTNLNEKTRWLHLETPPPQCIPSDAAGARQDLIKYARGTILCETDGKHDWIQTGEMIKVGLAWRIIDAPMAGDGNSETVSAAIDPALQGLLDQLRDHDAKAPKGIENGGTNADIVKYNLARAGLLEQIVAKVKPEEREQWIRQVAECLSAAAQNSPENDTTAYQRLLRLEEQIVQAMPGSNLAAFVTFREMTAYNAAKLAKPGPDTGKIQEQWLDRLTKFVTDYPKAEDTPDALIQLGMVTEFMNKEIEARKWYGSLVKEFPEHPLAPKAAGALRRLELEGKPLELSGTLLDGSPFDITQLRGKIVVVYYWASWNKERCVPDFATLKLLLDNHASKGLTLVGVNLDNTAEEAKNYLQRSPSPGVHLFQAGGLESPLATKYGIMVLPNIFLVDKEGKVISRNIQQVSNLEDEIKKRLN
jgi:hypothetical protein